MLFVYVPSETGSCLSTVLSSYTP